MNEVTIREEDLHAYVDGQLSAEHQTAVADYLRDHPEAAARVATYKRQNEALRALLDPVLTEPVPAALQATLARHRPAPFLRYTAVAASMVLSATLGWWLNDQREVASPLLALQTLPVQAVLAHHVYAPEVLHPVEVGADQEAHLTAWLSKRLGHALRVPHLGEAGFDLVGGRLLPGTTGPAAQFMYQDAQGARFTLYVSVQDGAGRDDTAFRYATEDGVSVFYWVDGPLGYALSGEVGRDRLLVVAENVYRQLGM